MARVFDPYLIPGTNVLRNLVGATDKDALAAAENDLCSARAAILRENLPPAEGTLEQLRRIHRFLFQDVYDWAGEIRTIDMGKGEGLPFQPLELFSIGVHYSEGTQKSGSYGITMARGELFAPRFFVFSAPSSGLTM